MGRIWQCPVYNALGQRVEDDQSDGQGMQLYYPRDIFGDRTGIWDDHPSAHWVGWDVYFSKVAGQRLNMGGSSAYIDHADAVGSTTMETDPAAGGTKLPVQNSGARRFSIANRQSQRIANRK